MVEEEGWPRRLSDLPDGGEFDAVIWRVKLKELRQRPPFDWESYPALRVMRDHDTYRNYPELWPASLFHGEWTSVIRQQEFDLVLVSGKRVCEFLRGEGVPAVWMPKAYEAGRLFDRGEERHGIGYYGSLYSARRVMLDHLDRSLIAVRRFQCPASELNDHLNRCLGVVVCNMGAVHEGPGQAVSALTTVPETMLKNFEVGAAGTAPVCDPTPDLADLGFVDGLTAVVYSTFEELVDRLREYLNQPDRLRDIGRRASELVRERHTWDHRVAFLERVLRSRGPASWGLSWDLPTELAATPLVGARVP